MAIALMIPGCSKDDDEGDDSFYIYEDFEDGTADHFTSDGSGAWSVLDSVYVMTGTGSGDSLYSYYDARTFKDFALSVDVKPTGSNTDLDSRYGIYFWSETPNPFYSSYLVTVNGDGCWCLYKYVDGASPWEFIWNGSVTGVVSGVDNINQIQLISDGSSLNIYFNGTMVYGSTRKSTDPGYVGFFAFDDSGYTNQFAFDDFLITEADYEETIHVK